MNSNMEKMLEIASKRLGMSSSELKQALEKGDSKDMMKNLRPEDSAKLKTILSSPAMREKLMKSPEAAELLRKMGDKNG